MFFWFACEGLAEGTERTKICHLSLFPAHSSRNYEFQICTYLPLAPFRSRNHPSPKILIIVFLVEKRGEYQEMGMARSLHRNQAPTAIFVLSSP